MNLGIDIGGNSIKAAIISHGKIIKKLEVKTGKEKKIIIEQLINIIKKLDKNNIGIGCPGPLDIKKGIILNTPNIPLQNVRLKQILKKKFRKKIFIDNDANCFTLAEALYGAARKNKYVIGLTLGTGIGSGFVIDKKIYHGRGKATELGHTTINFSGPKCNCGNKGCAESYLNANAIVKKSKLKIKNPAELYFLAKKHNKQALKEWKEYGKLLGIFIANIVDSFDPDIIVIGGNIAKAWNFFNKSMLEESKRAIIKPCKVVKAKLKDSGIIGAGSLVK